MAKITEQGRLARILCVSAVFTISLAIGSSPSWAIVVTTLADPGPGSLRQAIIDANADGIATTITFDPVVFPPPPALPGFILLATELPALTDAGDTIDGTGAGVVIDGSGSAAGSRGLRIRRSGITVRGLTIQNFPNDGIRVDTQGPSAAVTDVLITGNTLFRNGNRGIRVSGGTGPGKTVSATITNNTVSDSADSGISVFGNLLGNVGSGDFGGNQVTVLVDGNTVKRSKQGINTDVLGGDGIQIVGGIGDGSNNVVTATVSNNDVNQNRDDGIVVVGCGLEDAGSNNTVFATIANNTVRNNGLNADLISNIGIVVTGASGEQGTSTTCVGNTIQFNIFNNDSMGNRTSNISISGGTGSGHDVQGNVSQNTAKDSPEGDGILVSGGGGTGNTVHDITISRNQVSGNFNRGVIISGGNGSTNAILTGIDVLSNNVRANGSQGIFLTGGTNSLNAIISDLLIDRNTSSQNGARGIHVTLGSTSINPAISLAGITNNTANSNASDGIFIGAGIPGSGATPVSGNRADRNGQDGIDIDSTGYVLSNNTASGNTVDGINAVGNINGGGNKATGNASCNTRRGRSNCF